MTRTKKTAILLPFFNPSKSVIQVGDLKIKTANFSDLEKTYKTSLSGMDFNFGELSKLNKKRRGKKTDLTDSLWTILEKEDSEIPDICYTAILELITSHWKYVLIRNEELKRPISYKSVSTLNPPTYNFNKTIVEKFEYSIKLLKEKRFQIALQRWSTSYRREDTLNSVLDCCSALESMINCETELRLRIALSSYHILKKGKKSSMLNVYEMYGVRNKFIHGSSIPSVNNPKQLLYIETIANILKTLIQNQKMPDKKLLYNKIINDYN